MLKGIFVGGAGAILGYTQNHISVKESSKFNKKKNLLLLSGLGSDR